jgi:hypothetical protein
MKIRRFATTRDGGATWEILKQSPFISATDFNNCVATAIIEVDKLGINQRNKYVAIAKKGGLATGNLRAKANANYFDFSAKRPQVAVSDLFLPSPLHSTAYHHFFYGFTEDLPNPTILEPISMNADAGNTQTVNVAVITTPNGKNIYLYEDPNLGA